MIPQIPLIKYSGQNNFFLIAGPCVVENEAIIMETAESIAQIGDELKLPVIFKSSYRKANRSRNDSFTGIGDEKALKFLRRVREEFSMPVLTDIHTAEDAAYAAGFADVLQIPAFLCRQTDLLSAAGKTGKFVNIKKGQFLAPGQMQFAAQKVNDAGNLNILLTERGTTFGYDDLVVDFRGIPIMQQTGYPVVMDCTHSLQQPNKASGITGGLPHMIEVIAKAAIAVGVDGLFIETHPDPTKAKSDGANMLPLRELKNLLKKLVSIRMAIMQTSST